MLDHPGATGVGLINRCKRSAMLFSKVRVRVRFRARARARARLRVKG